MASEVPLRTGFAGVISEGNRGARPLTPLSRRVPASPQPHFGPDSGCAAPASGPRAYALFLRRKVARRSDPAPMPTVLQAKAKKRNGTCN